MKKVLFIILIILPLLGLIVSSCAFDVSTNLYMQDVADLIESQQTITMNATLAVEFSGEDEEFVQVTDFLSEALLGAENFRLEDRDSQTYLLADYKIPLVYAADFQSIAAFPDVQANIFAIAVLQESDMLSLYATFNQPRFDGLNARLSDELNQGVALNEGTIRILLTNDMRETVNMTVFSMYAGDVPVPYVQTLTLERRDEIELRFSDVLRDSLSVAEETDDPNLHIRKFAEITFLTQ